MKELEMLIDQIETGKINTEQAMEHFHKYFNLDYIIDQKTEENSNTVVGYIKTDFLSDGKSKLFDIVQTYLIKKIGEILSIIESEIETSTNFLDMGLASTQLIQMTEFMEKDLSIALYPTVLFEYQNIQSLSTYLANEFSDRLGKHFKIDESLNKIAITPISKNNVKEYKEYKKEPDHQKNVFANQLEVPVPNVIHDIAIVGVSGIFPGSNDLDQFWDIIKNQKDVISEIPEDRWDWRDVQKQCNKEIRWGGFIKDIDKFDAAFFGISPREAEMMDPQQRILIETIWRTIEDAGYKTSDISGTNTGLFIGISTNDYSELMIKASTPVEAFTSIGTIHSIVANRISYMFDFHGPSMAIDTACSSALVALYEAINAIRTGKCKAAIVGGVNALLSPKLFISFSKAGMLSEDGRCKTFDKRANGYVRGEGVGAVFLKPLQQAQEDGNQIYAVIKGCAINHGGHANSMTAPNPNAQANLIIDALKDADLDITTISYIEAHGTGTSLGDPIEIEGLKKAYASLSRNKSVLTIEKRHCGIGSIKTNIGHLESAAGMAGLLKVILSMKHGKIPGILHFENINPYIDLTDTSFYIVDKTRDWDRLTDEQNNEIPRRAGVSSFGFGGANAHVILEEYKESEARETAEHSTPQIIPLSAKTEDQLKQYAKNLLNYLNKANIEIIKEHTKNNEIAATIARFVADIINIKFEKIDKEELFIDLGFTAKEYDDLIYKINDKYNLKLTIGLFSIVKTVNDMAAFIKKEITAEDDEETTEAPQISLKEVAYTLQVGRNEMNERLAIIAGSLEDLKGSLAAFCKGDSSAVYHENVKNNKIVDLFIKGETGDDYFMSLIKKQEYEKIAQLWVHGGNIDWKKLHGTEKIRRISLPTYPFTGKRYWIPTGITKGRIGLSSIDHPLLGHNASTLKEQKFCTEFDGKEFFLKDHVVNGKKVLPGAAYMEMVRAAGQLAGECKVSRISNIIWNKPLYIDEEPRKVYISLYPEKDGVGFDVWSADPEDDEIIYAQGTLNYIEENEAGKKTGKIEINSIKERCTERINGESCYAEFRAMGLEYGDAFRTIRELYIGEGESLGKLVLPDTARTESEKMLLPPSLLDGAFQSVLGSIGMGGVNGTYVPHTLGALEIIDQIPMNCYVNARLLAKEADGYRFQIRIFDEEGYIVANLNNFKIRTIMKIAADSKAVSMENLLYCEHAWVEQTGEDSGGYIKNILIFDTDDQLLPEVRNIQKNNGLPDSSVHIVKAGASYKELAAGVYEIQPDNAQDYEKLFERLKALGKLPMGIIYLWAYRHEGDLAGRLSAGVYPLHRISKTLTNMKNEERIKLIYVYKTAEDKSTGADAAVGAFIRSLKEEDRNLCFKSVGVPGSELEVAGLLKIIFSEFNREQDTDIQYQENIRYVHRLTEVNIKEEALSGLSICDGGVYVITGGSGKLGLRFAEYIGLQAKVKIALLDLRPLDEEKRQRIAELRKSCAEVIYVEGNVGVKEDVERAIKEIHNQLGEIKGIVHCAGLLRDSLVKNQEEKDFAAVIAPKIKGTVYLDEATRGDKLDFFILFSSIASVIGNAGQTAYSLGNGYMDWYAVYRDKLCTDGIGHGRTISINWPLWKSGGMNVSKEVEKSLYRTKGISLLTTEAGLEGFKLAISGKRNQIIIFTGNKKKLQNAFNILNDVTGKGIQETGKAATTVNEDNDNNKKYDDQIRTGLKKGISEIASQLLHIEENEIDPAGEMSEYGFDSILLTDFSNKLNEIYGIDITPTIFYAYPTLNALASHLCKEYKSNFINYWGIGSQKEIAATAHGELTAKQKNDNKIKKTRSINRDFSVRNRSEDIAVIGISGVMPQSRDLHEFWKNLEKGNDCITEIPPERWDWREWYGDPEKEINRTYVKWGGFMPDVDKFDSLFFGISPLEAELMDPQQRIFLETVWKTIEDAGYRPSEFSGTNTGLFVGVSTNDYYEQLLRQNVEIKAQTATGRANSILPNRISYMMNLSGPSEPIDTACSSALVAVYHAIRSIQNGDCKMAIAGGVNVLTSPTLFVAFSKAGMLSNDGRCKTFDKRANGYVRGEGVGAVLLKPLRQAEEDGDHIYAVIKACAINHGGHANSMTAPNPNAQAELLVRAYDEADIPIDTVTYLEAHGTGTSLGDPIEINALKQAFGELHQKTGSKPISKKCCGISAVKTNIGHLESAAGIAGLLKVILSMKYGKIPGILHFENINPYIDLTDTPFYIVDKTKGWERLTDEQNNEIPRRAGVSSFGFGGANAHVVLEEYIKNE
ncbi:MAG TPA: SDR family NAD(P)-dependent oxidoreductase [Methylomusa anaerophila]|uniref:Polyketide synthase PksN n=1 Tax=Methylomusa anaerophila TaxID=1930071 RepID=A0A348AQS6_9FIRM|nr:SDR family NAD(P)-dependent oxidoreductase [Methylomusa anaerophila]BBB93424.1 polyketide synthase PksN [Methylomusa anaerophila]HML90049.1 SDR family NAD(P)-dependent oxidoreductase [Methylomusa anaerophila]